MNKVILALLVIWVGPVSFGSETLRYVKHVQVIDPDKQKLKQLVASNPELIVDHVSSLGYEVYGPSSLEKTLAKNNLQFLLIKQEHNKKLLTDYPSPEQSIQSMKTLQSKYPSLISLIEIGKSSEGRSLLFAKLTSKQNDATLPEFKYIANMHGDEIVGREMMIKFIDDLASNYGKDARITKLLDSVQIYIMPSMNPDGAAAQKRFNGHDVDLNRSFPDFTDENNNQVPGNNEPEIQAMIAFQAAHHFKLSANFHGGAEVVNYPWDGQAAPFPLDNLVKKISLDYAQGVPYIYNSTEFTQGITNGFAWYRVVGGMQDWSYHWFNDLQVTIELSEIKWPDYSVVDQDYQANRNSLIGFIEEIGQI